MMLPGRSRDLHYYLLLIAVVLLAYWPISLGIFSLKYDAIVYFLPWRFHISEAIQSGEFPFWSPFLYTGLPLHADMQSGAWNPLVWFLSSFGRYNMLTLQIEVTIYLIIAAIGFFKLCRHFQFSQETAFICAAAYCCNGFFTDSVSIIPWITSSAYLPYVFLYFFRLAKQPGLNSAVKLSIAFALLFTASYPSYFVITGYVLLAIMICKVLTGFGKKPAAEIRFSAYLLLAAIITAILCLPALISYVDFFPYYSRSKGITLGEAQYNPFHVKNLISYIAPIASYKIEAGNDRLARNAYIGIFLLLFLIYSFKSRWRREQTIAVALSLFFFCFSLGAATPLRSFLYDILPFMDSFRHPAAARIFTNGSLIFLAAYGMERFLADTEASLFRNHLIIGAAFLALITIVCIFLAGDVYADVSFNISALKNFKDQASFSSLLLISAFLQVVFLLAGYWLLKKMFLRLFLGLIVTNLIVFTWLAAPFNMISRHRTSALVAFTEQYPKGFPPETLSKTVSVRIGDSTSVTDLGYPGFYEKQIIIHDRLFNPTLNNAYTNLLSEERILNGIRTYPAIWFEIKKETVRPLHFSANSFSVATDTDSAMHLVAVQQFNHNWRAYIDGKPYPRIEKVFSTYMMITVPAGEHQVTFKYEPKMVITASYFAIGLLVLLIVYLCFKKLRSSSPAKPGVHARP